MEPRHLHLASNLVDLADTTQPALESDLLTRSLSTVRGREILTMEVLRTLWCHVLISIDALAVGTEYLAGSMGPHSDASRNMLEIVILPASTWLRARNGAERHHRNC